MAHTRTTNDRPHGMREANSTEGETRLHTFRTLGFATDHAAAVQPWDSIGDRWSPNQSGHGRDVKPIGWQLKEAWVEAWKQTSTT